MDLNFCDTHRCPTVEIDGRQMCPVDWMMIATEGETVVDIVPGEEKGERIDLVFEGGFILPALTGFYRDAYTDVLPLSSNDDRLLDQVDGMTLANVQYAPYAASGKVFRFDFITPQNAFIWATLEEQAVFTMIQNESCVSSEEPGHDEGLQYLPPD